MPDLKHAELIDGVVFWPSPVARAHGTFHLRIGAWISNYTDSTPGTEGGAESTWVMGDRDTPQPDVNLRVLPVHGGQSNDSGVYNAGAPELIVEVTSSTMSRDLGVKLDLYRRAGVREYLSVILKPRQLIWRYLSRGRYHEIAPGDDGMLRSRVFPGLWLDPQALWNQKPLRTTLDQGLQSPEHASFVKRLAAARRRSH